MLALSVVGARVVADRHDDVRKAERVRDAMKVVDGLIHLRSALFAERVGVEILAPQWRPPEEVLETTEFGRVIVGGLTELEQATDDALRAMRPEDRPFALADLAQLRAERPEWGQSSETIRARLGPLTDRVEAVMMHYANQVRDSAVELGDRDLIAAGTTFHRSLRLPDAAGEIIGAVGDLWVGAPGNRVRLQATVVARRAHFITSADLFAASLVDPAGPVGRFWYGPMQVPASLDALLDEVETGALSDSERSSGRPVEVGQVLLEAIDWTLTADQLSLMAAGQLTEMASDVAGEARSAERVSAGLVLAAIAVSIAGAVLFGRSIVAPMRRLTDHAERVGSGELTLEPLPLSGPPDVAVASAAFNDVVGTLHLLEQKSRALADIELDHPSLDQPLPGELGAALQRSTEVLSASIVEREHLRSQLLHDATHDSLTGLTNRAALMDALAAIGDGAAALQPAALIFIDLDGFKRINDRLGHSAGDAVLQATADRIADLAPAGATVSRLGGDEFVVLTTGRLGAAMAEDLARAMVTAISAPIGVAGQVFVVRACAGVAFVGDGEPVPGPTHLLQRADLAAYDAKGAGPGSVVCYDAAFGRRVAEQTDVEMALAVALDPDADELRLVYQPIVAAGSGALVGVETLVRWDRPGHGRVQPDDFVPIAERSGLIVHLDGWVLRSVARQLAEWTNRPGLCDVRVAVNVSARTLLQSTFVDEVQAALEAYGLAPGRLALEVTETALVTDLALAATQLEGIRALGVRVAIDDFGTGFTSIAQLRALPVDDLKIDSSFVRRLLETDDRVLVQMISDLAGLLGLFTIAEGVETTAHVDALTAMGCDALQGYYFAHPADADGVARWIEERQRLTPTAH